MENHVEMLVENPGNAPSPALPFEEFRLGRRWRCPEMTVDLGMVQRFAELSGDRNPIHLDPDFARGTFYRGVIAHGMLVASLAAGGAFRGGLLGRNTLALESTSMKYLQPVRPGDRIYCDVTVASADPAAGKRFGRLVWHTEVFRVLAGRPSQLAVTVDWTLLVFKRAFLPEDEPLAAGSAPAPVTMAEPARRGLRQPLRRLRRA